MFFTLLLLLFFQFEYYERFKKCNNTHNELLFTLSPDKNLLFATSNNTFYSKMRNSLKT